MKCYYIPSKVGKFRELKLANAVKIVELLKASYTIIEIFSLYTDLGNLKGVSDIIYFKYMYTYIYMYISKVTIIYFHKLFKILSYMFTS